MAYLITPPLFILVIFLKWQYQSCVRSQASESVELGLGAEGPYKAGLSNICSERLDQVHAVSSTPSLVLAAAVNGKLDGSLGRCPLIHTEDLA